MKAIRKLLDIRCENFLFSNSLCIWKFNSNYKKIVLEGKFNQVTNSHLANWHK
jgi:hypothetical protein